MKIAAQSKKQQDLFSLRRMPENKVDLFVLQSEYNVVKFLGAGSYGLVVAVKPRQPSSKTDVPASTELVLKFQYVDGDDLIQEARVQRLLTQLWTNTASDLETKAPIIKVYDFSNALQTYPADQLLRWLTTTTEGEPMTEAQKYKVAHAMFDVAGLSRPYPDTFDNYMENARGVVFRKSAFLIGERLQNIWFQSITNYAIWPSMFMQLLLFLHSAQSILQFVHGDLHLGNIYATVVSDGNTPVNFRIAAARDAVFHITTHVFMQLGDFGFTRMKPPVPLNEIHNLPPFVNNTSAYRFQGGRNEIFRPWQDTMMIAWSILSELTSNDLYNMDIKYRRLLACMIDIVPDNQIHIDAKITDERIIESDMSMWTSCNSTRQTTVALLRKDKLDRSTNDGWFIRESARSNKMLIYNAQFYYSPMDIIMHNMDLFRAVAKTSAPVGVRIYDVSLRGGNFGAETLPAWGPLPNENLPIPEFPPSRATDEMLYKPQEETKPTRVKKQELDPSLIIDDDELGAKPKRMTTRAATKAKG